MQLFMVVYSLIIVQFFKSLIQIEPHCLLSIIWQFGAPHLAPGPCSPVSLAALPAQSQSPVTDHVSVGPSIQYKGSMWCSSSLKQD